VPRAVWVSELLQEKLGKRSDLWEEGGKAIFFKFLFVCLGFVFLFDVVGFFLRQSLLCCPGWSQTCVLK
jgi:hypothetical protein